MELDEVRNEVMRKVGRNLLLFQQVEVTLKFLVTNNDVSGFTSNLLARHKKKSNSVGKQTMGMVAGQFLSSTFSPKDEEDNVPEVLTEPHFSFQFRVEMEEGDRRAIELSMADLVEERNQLVHHFYSRIASDEMKSWLDADCYLDEQRVKIIAELKTLSSWAVALKEGRKDLFSFLATEEGKRQFFGEDD